VAKIEIIPGRFEQGLRKFKKKVQNEGLLQEMRDRQYFVKGSEKRKKAKAQAKSRWLRKLKESKPEKHGRK